MKYVLVAVFDSAVGTYMPPFAQRSIGEALRSFQVACRDDKTAMAQHPSDYALYLLAEFDDESGVVDELAIPPRLLMRAAEAAQAH